jgi:hypothetical protein
VESWNLHLGAMKAAIMYLLAFQLSAQIHVAGAHVLFRKGKNVPKKINFIVSLN